MINTIALRIVAILVLLPSTLVAGFWSLMGLGFSVGWLRRGEHTFAALVVLVAMAAGWFGLVTLWRLYYGFLRGRSNFNMPFVWAGLCLGTIVSLCLIATTGGSLSFRVIFFGWPLLAVAFFACVLWRKRYAI